VEQHAEPQRYHHASLRRGIDPSIHQVFEEGGLLRPTLAEPRLRSSNRLEHHKVNINRDHHQQAWSSGYDFCLTTQVFGYTEGSEFDSQGL
jgi:hypothetical protein